MIEIGKNVAIKKEIPVALRDKAIKTLMAMPSKVPTKEPVEAALLALKPAIKSLLANGYSRHDVIEVLGKEGIPVKLYQLKPLLARERQVRPK